MDVAGGEQFASADWAGCLADQATIHNDVGSAGEVLGGKLVFGGDVRNQGISSAGKLHALAAFKISEGNRCVIFRIELENLSLFWHLHKPCAVAARLWRVPCHCMAIGLATSRFARRELGTCSQIIDAPENKEKPYVLFRQSGQQ